MAFKGDFTLFNLIAKIVHEWIYLFLVLPFLFPPVQERSGAECTVNGISYFVKLATLFFNTEIVKPILAWEFL